MDAENSTLEDRQPVEGTEPKEGELKEAQGGEPTGEGLPEGWTPEKGLEIYKNLQREFGKQTETNKRLKETVARFEQFGGADSVLEAATKLTADPQFMAMVKSKEDKNKFGFDMSELDDETRNALTLVKNIAASIVDERLNAVRKAEIEPLSKQAQEKTLMGYFGQLDKSYGADLWRPFLAEMQDILPTMPQKAFNNIQYEDIEDLLWKAVRKTGKINDVSAKLYETKINEKKKKASEPSSVAAGGALKTKVKNMSEAFAMAKKELKQ